MEGAPIDQIDSAKQHIHTNACAFPLVVGSCRHKGQNVSLKCRHNDPIFEPGMHKGKVVPLMACFKIGFTCLVPSGWFGLYYLFAHSKRQNHSSQSLHHSTLFFSPLNTTQAHIALPRSLWEVMSLFCWCKHIICSITCVTMSFYIGTCTPPLHPTVSSFFFSRWNGRVYNFISMCIVQAIATLYLSDGGDALTGKVRDSIWFRIDGNHLGQ